MLHKSLHFENLKNLSKSTPAETDIIVANSTRIALPLSGQGGKVAVLEVAKSGKLPSGILPSLVHGTNVMDFCWDPFDNSKLYCALDDGFLNIWKIPDGGLKNQVN